MTFIRCKAARTFLVILALSGMLGPSDVGALTCAAPSLDTAYGNAAVVFVARLVSASVSDDFSARGELVLDTALKGTAPNKLSFVTNIGPLSSCGPDLIIGQAYLVFLIDEKPNLYLVNDKTAPDRSNDTFSWIASKLQTGSE
jgi:hypothetical protein